MGKLGNCFISVVYGNNTPSSADKVRLHEGRSVRESKAARHSAPGALISCDTKSISLVASCDGVNRGIGCGACEGASSIFFRGRCRFYIASGTLPLVGRRHNSSRDCRSQELPAPAGLSRPHRLCSRCRTPTSPGCLGESGLL